MGGEILRRQLRQTSLFSTPFGAVLAIAVLAAAAMLVAYLEPAADPVSGRARVSDGDSFRLGDQRIRLLGFDAPELSQTCTDAQAEEWPCGRAARDRMAALLSAGTVKCQPEDTDQYQRLLAYCSVGSVDLGQVMVSEGLAISAGGYWSEEQSARASKLGIWRGDFESPKSWRDDHPRGQGGFGLLSIFGL